MKYIVWAILVMPLFGCASSERFIPKNVVPAPNEGYVGGYFSLIRNFPVTSAFVLVNQDTKTKYILPFADPDDLSHNPVHGETDLIGVPPGLYQVKQWIVFDTIWGPGSLQGLEFSRDLKPGKLAEPFVVKPNQVVFLGAFNSTITWTYGFTIATTHGEFSSEPMTSQEASTFLHNAYPIFSSAEFKCTLCLY